MFNTKVFTFSQDSTLIGFDKFSCYWCEDVIEYKKDPINKDLNELYSFLKRNEYEYIIIDGQAQRKFAKTYGENETVGFFTGLVNGMASSNSFNVAFQNNGAIIFRIL